MKRFIVMIWTLLLGGCLGIPKGVQPVNDFTLERYLGTWYEIARLDHSFERGLEQVSAEYSLREDGGIKVVNRGYLPKEARWKQAEGKAYFMGPKNEGYLKVSFFGPFYGSYVVFGLDPASYQYAFVAGNTHDYLWLLARTPVVDPAVIDEFTQNAQKAGFATDALIFVNQKY